MDVYKFMVEFIQNGMRLDCKMVDQVVFVMKDWVIIKGVIYYMYWFQLLIGVIVEKYDVFFKLVGLGCVIE